MLRYSMLIQWLDTENVYAATFPDVPSAISAGSSGSL